MSDDFQRKMRRRAQVSAVARIVFMIFGVIAFAGGTVRRMGGCTPSRPVAAETQR